MVLYKKQLHVGCHEGSHSIPPSTLQDGMGKPAPASSSASNCSFPNCSLLPTSARCWGHREHCGGTFLAVHAKEALRTLADVRVILNLAGPPIQAGL